MNDIDCPFCNKGVEINHDDGAGYEEDVMHEQQCPHCEKVFGFLTSILYCYEARRTWCLNGEPHKYRSTHTIPIQRTKMECSRCWKRRKPTAEEMQEILRGEDDER